MELSKVLKKLLRERNEMKVVQLARATGVPTATLSNWLSGQKPRDLEQVKKVADFLEVSLNELLFNERPKAVEEPFESYKEEIHAGIWEVILRKAKHR